ncbi:MAG: GNAT family N-acetyltransferase [Lentisphaeria bacterium]|nr:GNAT family N-acetyltransferase [Lentisphaeria bacterium]
MNVDNSKIRIEAITDRDRLGVIGKLAWKIFPRTYEGLIPPEQTPYMMRIMYDDAVLRKEFSEGMKFDLILDDATPIGYICWHPADDGRGGKMLRLEKLYLDFDWHGRAIGNLALRHVIAEAEKLGASFITLNVNKRNLRAQKAYVRAGFYRWRCEKEPVGGGFFKDDYIMRYDLAPNRGGVSSQ